MTGGTNASEESRRYGQLEGSVGSTEFLRVQIASRQIWTM